MTANPTTQPLLDLQQLVVTIRRQRRFWLSLGLLGLLAGVALAILMPPPPTAVTRLLIIHEGDQPTDGGTLMKTDATMMETTRIAAAALQKLNINEPPEDFLKTYDAHGLTNNVLELKVTGSDDGDAVARAQALADAFIADYVQRIEAAASADAQALINQRNRAEEQLREVNAEIAAVEGENKRDTPIKLEALYARRAEFTSRISDLTRRAEDAGIGKPRVAAGTQIVDAPRALAASPKKMAATNGALGLVVGLVLGLALSAVRTVVRDRPVLRRDIAAHLRSSVIAQLRAPRGLATLWRPWRRRAERRRIAAMLVRATRGDLVTVSLLELGSARITIQLAMDMAAILTAGGPGGPRTAGGPVLLVDGLPGGKLSRQNKNRQPDQGPIQIVDASDRVVDPHRPPGQRHSQIGLGSVSPGTAWTDLGQLGSETVLVVRAGRASVSWLHTVARQLADLQIRVIGVVLVDPDPRDRTDGTLWAGMHTAMRGRAQRHPLGPPLDPSGQPLGRASGNGVMSPAFPPPGDGHTSRYTSAGRAADDMEAT